MRSRDQGQATVELALAVPLVALVALLVVQVGLIARQRVMLTHAAREAARAAVVDPDPSQVAAAAHRSSDLPPDRLRVEVETDGGYVTVELTLAAPTDVPLIGPLLGDVTLTERLTGRSESAGDTAR